jgi:uncharacterized protein YhfF
MTTNISSDIEAYFQRFLQCLPSESDYRQYRWIAEAWGTGTMADELGHLIASGKKTASCTTWWEFIAEGGKVPALDLLTVVLDARGNPLCVIETYQIEVRPFNEVTAEFAAWEGEGDGSYEYWRNAHWNYFSRTLKAIGKEPAVDMPLVCERYRVVYKEE